MQLQLLCVALVAAAETQDLFLKSTPKASPIPSKPAPVCSLWPHVDAAWEFTQVVGFFPGSVSFDSCCDHCASTANCSFFTTSTVGCTLGSEAAGLVVHNGSSSGSATGPALPPAWDWPHTCPGNPNPDCAGRFCSDGCCSAFGCSCCTPMPRSAAYTHQVGPDPVPCTYWDWQANPGSGVFPFAIAGRQWVAVSPFAEQEFKPACSVKECSKPKPYQDSGGCNCPNATGGGQCCGLDKFDWFPNQRCAGARGCVPAPDWSNDHPPPFSKMQTARCWARDPSTGQLFCSGFDNLTLVDQRKEDLRQVLSKGNCSQLPGPVRFIDGFDEHPPPPMGSRPLHGFCPESFCNCCRAATAQVGGGVYNATSCGWQCSVDGSAATAHACRKPKVDALSRCGEQAYPEAFEPCKTLCAQPTY